MQKDGCYRERVSSELTTQHIYDGYGQIGHARQLWAALTCWALTNISHIQRKNVQSNYAKLNTTAEDVFNACRIARN
jgi:hypothetical protein